MYPFIWLSSSVMWPSASMTSKFVAIAGSSFELRFSSRLRPLAAMCQEDETRSRDVAPRNEIVSKFGLTRRGLVD